MKTMTHEEALKTIEQLHDNYSAELLEDLTNYVLEQQKK